MPFDAPGVTQLTGRLRSLNMDVVERRAGRIDGRTKRTDVGSFDVKHVSSNRANARSQVITGQGICKKFGNNFVITRCYAGNNDGSCNRPQDITDSRLAGANVCPEYSHHWGFYGGPNGGVEGAGEVGSTGWTKSGCKCPTDRLNLCFRNGVLLTIK